MYVRTGVHMCNQLLGEDTSSYQHTYVVAKQTDLPSHSPCPPVQGQPTTSVVLITVASEHKFVKVRLKFALQVDH